jgi:hypothetical protein
MKYNPRSDIAGHLSKHGLDHEHELDAAEHARLVQQFRKSPSHAHESPQELHDRAAYFMIWDKHSKSSPTLHSRVVELEKVPDMNSQVQSLNKTRKTTRKLLIGVLVWLLVIVAVLFVLAVRAHTQTTVTVQGVAKGTTTNNKATVDTCGADANHNCLSVGVPQGVTITSLPANSSINLSQYGGVTVGAANALHIQPGTSAVFHTICDSGCGGAASFADSSAFTFATTAVNNMSAVVDDVSTNTVAENSAGALRMTTNRILYVDLSKTGANTNKLLVTTDPITFASAQAVTQSGTWTVNIGAGSAVIGHVIADSGSTTAVTGNVTVVQPTGTNLHAVIDTGSTTAVTGNVTAVQPTGTNLHAVLDATSTTAVTQATGTNLHAVLDSGTTTVTQGTGTNLHAVTDSGSTTAVTQATAANLNATVVQATGANLHVNCDSGCGGAAADQTASGSLGALNAAVQVALAGLSSASVTLPSGNNLIGTIIGESSSDGGTTWQATVIRPATPSGIWAASVAVSSTNLAYNIQVPGGASHVRAKVSAYTSGSATAGLRAVTQQDALPDPLVQGTQAAGSATQPNPMAGGVWDGTNLRTLKGETDGTLDIKIPTAVTVTLPTQPFLNITDFNDVTAGTPVRGDVITVPSTGKWTRLPKGSALQELTMDSTATDAAWATPPCTYDTSGNVTCQGIAPQGQVTIKSKNFDVLLTPDTGSFVRLIDATHGLWGLISGHGVFSTEKIQPNVIVSNFPGADTGAQINAASTWCGANCQIIVDVPGTTISTPLVLANATTLTFVPGSFLWTAGASTISGAGVKIRGAGHAATDFTVNNATSDVFIVTGQDFELSHVQVRPTGAARTAGSVINAQAANGLIEDVKVVDMFNFYTNTTPGAGNWIFLNNSAATSGGNWNYFMKTQAATTSLSSFIIIGTQISTKTSVSTSPLFVFDTGTDGIVMSGTGCYSNNTCIALTDTLAGAVKPRWIKLIDFNSEADSTHDVMTIAEGRDISIVASYFASAQNGITMSGGKGIKISDTMFVNNFGHGMNITGGSDVHFSNDDFADNSVTTTNTSDGIKIAANVQNVQVLGSRFGDFIFGNTNKMKWGIEVAAGTTAGLIIDGNSFLGTFGTGTVSNGATSGDFQVRNNIPASINQANPLILKTSADFVTAANTNLQTITGLSWVMPVNTAMTQNFSCELLYSQQTAAVAADAFGVQAASLAPTQINAQGHVELTVGPPSTYVDGNLTALNTTTATNIIAFTASAITTIFNAHISGQIENPSGVANTINIMAKTGTAADTLTVKRGSFCVVN